MRLQYKFLALFLFIVSSFQLYSYSNVFTGPDTTLKYYKDVIYTHRDFYFDVLPDCWDGIGCIDNFKLIITYNIAVTDNDIIKDADFSSGLLEFNSKRDKSGQLLKQYFKISEKVFNREGYKTQITFVPDLSKYGKSKPVFSKCIFKGYLKPKGGCAGTFYFYTPSGESIQVAFR